MVSLNERWQAQTQQRQHNVQEMLIGLRAERSQIAMQLREHLRSSQNEIRQQTRILLADVSQQRQEVTVELSARLSNFRLQLQHQTAQILMVMEAERSLMAQHLTDDLGEFHQQLTESVALLRQELQMGIAAIASDVQTLRSQTQEDLAALQQERLSTLATLVDSLRADTQDYLADLAATRKQRAAQIHTQFQTNRAHRQIATQTLRQECAHFRLALRQHRASLRHSVWGKTVEQRLPHQPVAAISTPPPDQVPLAVELSRSSTCKRGLDLSGVTTLSLDQTDQDSEPKALESIANVQPLRRDPVQLETDILTYIRKVQGARLTEIETALEMNRFQTVDALRSLIKKGLVTQRDRTYLAQDQLH